MEVKIYVHTFSTSAPGGQEWLSSRASRFAPRYAMNKRLYGSKSCPGQLEVKKKYFHWRVSNLGFSVAHNFEYGVSKCV
jgi:hypothetical protein